MLIENGFTPEWITLQKEIRQEIEMLRESLNMERKYLGPNPLNAEDINKWDAVIEKHKKLKENINKKINKFNLVVPVLNKQMLFIDLNKEAEKILLNGKCNLDWDYKKTIGENNEYSKESVTENLFGFLDTIFKK